MVGIDEHSAPALPDAALLPPEEARAEHAQSEPAERRRASLVRRVAMRGRRVFVKLHRWIGLALLAWLVVVAITGTWLTVHHSVESWTNGGRYDTTPGDVGPDDAAAAAADAMPDDAELIGLTLPRNGRGVYIAYFERPTGEEPVNESVEPPHEHRSVYVDPGSGRVNEIVDDEAGATWWLYRGHMTLWQDYGVFGVFDPESGWCREGADGIEPGGVRGVVCDVIPSGDDMIAYFGIGWIVVLLTGFYLWYWPGVKRWATALTVRRGRGAFAFNMSLHKVIGFVVWVPLLVVTFTGIAFAFPNLKGWYENATPAQRDMELWVGPEESNVSSDAEGREPIGLNGFIDVLERAYDDRAIEVVYPPFDETGTYTAWVTRGFSPWTREGGAGNVFVSVDQYSGEILYDGTPEEGNAFDQTWSDWSFPLHTGDFIGTPTRIAWMLLALSPLALGATGLIMNRIRHRKRARVTQR